MLELDESIEAGLQREVREETGLTIGPVALTGVYKNMTHGIVALVIRGKVIGGHLATNDEVSGFQWATAEKVKEMADEAFTVRVIDARANDSVPAVRKHDGVRIT